MCSVAPNGIPKQDFLFLVKRNPPLALKNQCNLFVAKDVLGVLKVHDSAAGENPRQSGIRT